MHYKRAPEIQILQDRLMYKVFVSITLTCYAIGSLSSLSIMKNYQNQLERFRNIAKRLVDDHCAALHNDEAYKAHLDALMTQLEENAQQFMETTRTNTELLKSDIRKLCNKYTELFIRRNETAF